MQPVIKVQNLVQQYGDRRVLDNISFTVEAGECFGVFGTRMMGKSTLLHILTGLDRFTSGQVEVLGCLLPKNEAFKKHLGLVTQQPSLFPDLRVGENLDFIAVLKNVPRKNITPLVEQLALTEFLRHPLRNLEAGVYQRLALACALLNQPKLLVVDELINDIDLPSRQLIFNVMKEFLATGGTCVSSFSNVEYLPFMSRVAWLEQGQLTLLTPTQAEEKWSAKLQSILQQSGEQHA